MCTTMTTTTTYDMNNLFYRDGGLKRQRVKDSYRAEQQKMYSSIIVGQNGLDSPKAHNDNTEDTGDTGPHPDYHTNH